MLRLTLTNTSSLQVKLTEQGVVARAVGPMDAVCLWPERDLAIATRVITVAMTTRVKSKAVSTLLKAEVSI